MGNREREGGHPNNKVDRQVAARMLHLAETDPLNFRVSQIHVLRGATKKKSYPNVFTRGFAG